RRAARRRRRRCRDLGHPRRTGGDRRRPAHGPGRRPAAGVRRCAGPLLETGHQVQAGRRCDRPGEARPGTAAGPRHRGVDVRPGGPGARGARPGIRPRRRQRLTARPMTAPASLPFDDSRRLTGPNLYFANAGVVLETGVGAPVPRALIDGWRQRIERARAVLHWPDGPVVVRDHATGASLAFAAPADRLYTATEVNEWAWLSTLAAAGMDTGEPALQPAHAPINDDDAAFRVLRAAAAAEHLPR